MIIGWIAMYMYIMMVILAKIHTVEVNRLVYYLNPDKSISSILET